jgi:peptide/nickel transport system substrate-binding protein
VETPDDTTYVFKIRPGVKIAPNDIGIPERDLDGEDVRATFERLKTDATTNAYSFANKYIESVSVSGDIVTMKTTEPYAWLIQRISGYNSVIPPREVLADLTKVQNRGVGGGPYSVVSVAENDAAKLKRNPNFYRHDPSNNDAQLPYVENLEVRVIFDRGTQRTAFLSGQTHQYWAQNGDEARGLGDYPIAREPVFAFISMTMNPLRPPFTDPRARRAVSRAINRQQIIDVVYTGDAQANGLVHWPLGSYALPEDELRTTHQPFDIADARALAEAAGGVTLKLTYPSNTTIQEHGDHLSVVVEQMRAAGIQVEELPLEFSNWITNYHDLSYDCSLGLNQIYETPELPLLFHASGGPFSDNTYIQGLNDAEVDAAIRKANTTLDLDRQVAAVHDAQRVIYGKDPGFLPLVGPYLHMAYSKKLHNIPTGVGTTSYSLSDYWIEA